MSTRRQWARGAALVGFLMASGATAAQAATLCVNPAGSGGCYTTIQAAVIAAAPFDTVKVGAGTYHEGVAVSGRDGLQIIGAGKTSTIIDPGAYAPTAFGGAPFGIGIASQNVQIKNLMVRNGTNYGLYTVANGTVFQGVSVSGTDLVGIYIQGGWNAQVIQSEVHDSQYGIATSGFGTVIKNSTVSNTFYGVYVIAADGAQVVSSHFANIVIGVYAVNSGTDGANGLTVKSNDIRHTAGAGVYVSGSLPTIVSNKVFGTGVGILVDCTACFGGSVASNTVTDASGYAILAVSDGAGLTLLKNSVSRTGLGISLNVATPPGQNGFTIDGNGGAFGSSVLLKNKTTLDAAQGFAIIGGATGTSLSLNSASKNRVDFCDQGAGTVLSGNTFGTTSATCDIAH
jgi:hypothetical protein